MTPGAYRLRYSTQTNRLLLLSGIQQTHPKEKAENTGSYIRFQLCDATHLLLFCFSRQEKYSLLSNKLPFTKVCIQHKLPVLSTTENLDEEHIHLLHLQNLFREQVPPPLLAPSRILTYRKMENDRDSCPQQTFD